MNSAVTSTVLDALKWCAIGHEEEITDSSCDTFGHRCIFDCGYDTSIQVSGGSNLRHSENCLQTRARKELVALNYVLKKYIIEYAVELHPISEAYIPSMRYMLRKKEYTRKKEIYTIERKLAVHPEKLVAELLEEENARIDKNSITVSIDPKTIEISQPEYFFE